MYFGDFAMFIYFVTSLPTLRHAPWVLHAPLLLYNTSSNGWLQADTVFKHRGNLLFCEDVEAVERIADISCFIAVVNMEAYA